MRTYSEACQYGEECEHCDGEHSSLFRIDDLRGRVCPVCDDALDRMEAEEPANV